MCTYTNRRRRSGSTLAYSWRLSFSLYVCLPVCVCCTSACAQLTGEVAGRDAIIIDDMVDTGTTIVRAARELIARGAARVFAVATHGILSGDAADRLARCEELSLLVLTNTLSTLSTMLPASHKLRRKIAILSVAPLLANRICTLAGLPPPDVDPDVPTHPLHGGGSVAQDSELDPAYMQAASMSPNRRAMRGVPQSTESLERFFRDGGGESDSLMETESVTTASEYSANY